MSVVSGVVSYANKKYGAMVTNLKQVYSHKQTVNCEIKHLNKHRLLKIALDFFLKMLLVKQIEIEQPFILHYISPNFTYIFPIRKTRDFC